MNRRAVAGQIGLALMFLLGAATPGAAEGQLVLIAHTDEGRQKLVLHESNGEVTGTLREGLAQVTPVRLALKGKEITYSIGDKDYSIERMDLGHFIAYGGVIFDQRGLSAQAERMEDKWYLLGVMEDDLNRLVEFNGVADEQGGELELTWKDNFIVLKRITQGDTGACRGTLVKKTALTVGRFSCKSSGTLKDAL
nr:hypothetical protein [Nitrospinaceae bacterium]NIR57451.1 hypothetical protein [Nitrospinaceae bacterium]NIS87918.1 hypothetical protein [Nitrospinaceae bacterium]NIT84786.1 hypothetical protein [Nitrospinaceae bacterium]NIU46962.1 hypothetical protein [Nitrospinaceae bacterium]